MFFLRRPHALSRRCVSCGPEYPRPGHPNGRGGRAATPHTRGSARRSSRREDHRLSPSDPFATFRDRHRARGLSFNLPPALSLFPSLAGARGGRAAARVPTLPGIDRSCVAHGGRTATRSTMAPASSHGARSARLLFPAFVFRRLLRGHTWSGAIRHHPTPGRTTPVRPAALRAASAWVGPALHSTDEEHRLQEAVSLTPLHPFLPWDFALDCHAPSGPSMLIMSSNPRSHTSLATAWHGRPRGTLPQSSSA